MTQMEGKMGKKGGRGDEKKMGREKGKEGGTTVTSNSIALIFTVWCLNRCPAPSGIPEFNLHKTICVSAPQIVLNAT